MYMFYIVFWYMVFYSGRSWEKKELAPNGHTLLKEKGLNEMKE